MQMLSAQSRVHGAENNKFVNMKQSPNHCQHFSFFCAECINEENNLTGRFKKLIFSEIGRMYIL